MHTNSQELRPLRPVQEYEVNDCKKMKCIKLIELLNRWYLKRETVHLTALYCIKHSEIQLFTQACVVLFLTVFQNAHLQSTTCQNELVGICLY